MKVKDVTRKVAFGWPDDESLPITKCVCGAKFEPWQQTIGVYNDFVTPMPCCGRKLVFTIKTKVHEVTEVQEVKV